MSDILQVGDSGPGICHSHSSDQVVVGTIISGSTGFTMEDGKILVQHGATVSLSCGHTGIMVSSNPGVKLDGTQACQYNNAWTTGTGVTTGNITTTKGGITVS